MDKKIFQPEKHGMVICEQCNSQGYIHPKRLCCPKCGGFGYIKKEPDEDANTPANSD